MELYDVWYVGTLPTRHNFMFQKNFTKCLCFCSRLDSFSASHQTGLGSLQAKIFCPGGDALLQPSRKHDNGDKFRKKKRWKFWNLFSAPELAAPNALSLSAILGCCDFATTIKNLDDFMHLLYHGILFFTTTTPRPVLWPRFKKKHKCHNKIAHEASLRKKLWTKALLPHQGHCQHQSRSTSTQPIFQAPCFHIIRSCEIAGDLKAHPGAVAPKILSKKLSQVAWLELRAVIAIGLGRFNQKNDP